MRRRLLLVAPFTPHGPERGRHGGARAAHGLCCALAEHHELTLVHLDREDGPVDPALADRCAAVHPVRRQAAPQASRRWRWAAALLRGRSLKTAESGVRELAGKVRELRAELDPDVVQVETGTIGDVLAAAGPALRVVTVYEPVAAMLESQSWRPPALPFVNRLDAWAAARGERRTLALADGAVVFTEQDRRSLRAPDGTIVATIPLGWDVPAAPLGSGGGGPPVLLFVGNFAHPPNVEAAVQLARAVMPLVVAAHPDAVLELVGESPPATVRELADASVRVTGPVPSVIPHLKRASIVLAPLGIGGGVRIKVLEALAAGKAVVASPRAAQGISARPGVDLIIADGPEQTARSVLGLLDDEAARHELAASARAWAERELDWGVMAHRYEELYARLAVEGVTRRATAAARRPRSARR